MKKFGESVHKCIQTLSTTLHYTNCLCSTCTVEYYHIQQETTHQQYWARTLIACVPPVPWSITIYNKKLHINNTEPEKEEKSNGQHKGESLHVTTSYKNVPGQKGRSIKLKANIAQTP